MRIVIVKISFAYLFFKRKKSRKKSTATIIIHKTLVIYPNRLILTREAMKRTSKSCNKKQNKHSFVLLFFNDTYVFCVDITQKYFDKNFFIFLKKHIDK